jgi:hypothetical protein
LLASASTHFAFALRWAQFVGDQRRAAIRTARSQVLFFQNWYRRPPLSLSRVESASSPSSQPCQLKLPWSGCRCDSASVYKPAGQAGGRSGAASSSQRHLLTAKSSGMLFVKFVVQFIDLHSGLVQRLLAGSRDLVDPATVPSNIFEDRLQPNRCVPGHAEGNLLSEICCRYLLSDGTGSVSEIDTVSRRKKGPGGRLHFL